MLYYIDDEAETFIKRDLARGRGAEGALGANAEKIRLRYLGNHAPMPDLTGGTLRGQ